MSHNRAIVPAVFCAIGERRTSDRRVRVVEQDGRKRRSGTAGTRATDSHDPEEPGVPRPRGTVGQVHTCMRRRTYEAVGSRNAALRRAMRRRDKPRVTMRHRQPSRGLRLWQRFLRPPPRKKHGLGSPSTRYTDRRTVVGVSYAGDVFPAVNDRSARYVCTSRASRRGNNKCSTSGSRETENYLLADAT